jgi:hypothetical protein
LSRRLNSQLFAVVGPAYVPDRISDLRTETQFLPRPAAPRWRWLPFGLIAAVLLSIAYVNNIGEATARGDAAAPIAQSNGVAPSIAIFGGGEPIRW